MVNFVAKWHLIWAQSIQEVKPKVLILILASVLDNWLCPARAAHYNHLNENRSMDPAIDVLRNGLIIGYKVWNNIRNPSQLLRTQSGGLKFDKSILVQKRMKHLMY